MNATHPEAVAIERVCRWTELYCEIEGWMVDIGHGGVAGGFPPDWWVYCPTCGGRIMCVGADGREVKR